jgi:hypothetical protein
MKTNSTNKLLIMMKIVFHILLTPSNSDRALDTNCLISSRSTGKFVF